MSDPLPDFVFEDVSADFFQHDNLYVPTGYLVGQSSTNGSAILLRVKWSRPLCTNSLS